MARKEPREIKDVWIDYKKTRTEALRNILMENYLHLVRYNAERIHAKLPDEVELDDLMSAGIFGLMDAIAAFDLERGVKFETYCAPRIRGAILDELRKQDHVPRNVRRRTRDVSRAREILARSLRRVPTHEELSTHLQVPTALLRKWELDAEGATMCSIDQTIRAEPSGATLGDTMADDRMMSIDDLLTREQEVGQLKVAIAGLKEQERTVLALNFFEELKLQEIASVLRLSVCRISQIRTAALAKLRVALSELRAA